MEAVVKWEAPLSGLVEVVEAAHRVEQLSLEGWKIVAFYQETRQEQVQEQDPSRPSQYGGGPLSYTTYKPSTITKFVMHLDEESALTKALADAKEHQRAAIACRAERDQAKKELAEAAKQDAMMKDEYARMQQRRDDCASALEAARTSNRKLEADIAKVRKAVGELKLKEILG